MQDCFQDAAADSQGFVGDATTVLRLASGIDIAAFHTCRYRDAVRQQAAQCPANSAAHGDTVDSAGNIFGGNLAADFQCTVE